MPTSGQKTPLSRAARASMARTMEAPIRAPSVDERCGVHRPWARFNKAAHARGSQRFLPSFPRRKRKVKGSAALAASWWKKLGWRPLPLAEEAKAEARAANGGEQKSEGGADAPREGPTGLSSFASTADPFHRQQPRGGRCSTGRVNDTGGPPNMAVTLPRRHSRTPITAPRGLALSPLRHLKRPNWAVLSQQPPRHRVRVECSSQRSTTARPCETPPEIIRPNFRPQFRVDAFILPLHAAAAQYHSGVHRQLSPLNLNTRERVEEARASVRSSGVGFGAVYDGSRDEPETKTGGRVSGMAEQQCRPRHVRAAAERTWWDDV
ncbi:hypothetical protein MTO96_011999 [Rhipicephalus appendiculatus]